MMELADFQQSFDAYAENPTRETAREVLKQSREYVKSHGRAAVGPMMAIMEFASDQNHVRCPAGMRAFVWITRLFTAPSRPGWNDYWMTRWTLRKDHESLIEIHRRAVHLRATNADWQMVRFTAEWMVNSQKETNPMFRYAMEIVEGRCPMCTGKTVTS